MTPPATAMEIETQGLAQEIKTAGRRFLWPAEKVDRLRGERLRALLRHAKSDSPWYRETLAHIDVETFTEADLPSIPTLDKATLMTNWDRIVTRPNLTLETVEAHISRMAEDPDLLYLHDQFHVLSTSGSSGTRATYVYDRHEWIQRNACNRRLPWLDQEGRPIAFASDKISLAHVVITNAVYGIYASPKTFKHEAIQDVYIPMTLPMEAICARLNAQHFDGLVGIPSTIHKLCLEVGKGRLSLNPKVVYSTAEPLYAPIRERIKKTWPDCYLFNAFASAEGVYARNCRADRQEMHMNDDVCIIEPVDQNARALGPGVRPTKLYLTNLTNHTLPLIRYESPDQLIFMDKACECGSHFRLIEEPQGRPEFNFTYPGQVYAHHLIFVTPLLHQKNIQEYQVQQTLNGAHIKLVPLGPVEHERLVNAITESLAQLGVANPLVTVEELAQLAYPASGKLRRFLTLEDQAP